MSTPDDCIDDTHRAACVREAVMREHAAAGQPLDPSELDGMTTAEIQDQLTYLADYQG